MRYFLITFSLKKLHSIGSLLLSSETFPSHQSIEEEVSRQQGYEVKVVVHGFFEFNNEQDYINYSIGLS